jgi:nitrate reductase molybdenum cofactor assembly chaperone NarJ/NarW
MNMRHYNLFARILDYPSAELAQVLQAGIADCQGASPEAATLLTKFKFDCGRLGLAQLEELYTNTFDLPTDCSLYAGYHLFGEDWRRSLFLAELMERYQAHGFSCGYEMPDHLVVLLQYLALEADVKEEMILLEDCLLPVVLKVSSRLDHALNPYRTAMEALLRLLRGRVAEAQAFVAMTPQPEEVVR